MGFTLQKLLLLFCLLGITWAGAAHAAPISDPLDNFLVTDGQVNAIARVGGLVYVGGAFTMVNRYSGSGVVINKATGVADLSWPAVNGPVLAAQKDGLGGWYIGGNFTVVGTLTRNGLAHILSDKNVDPNWDPNPTPGRRVRALLKVGNILYVGGDFENLSGTPRNRIGAFNTTTGQLTDWDPGADDDVYCLAVSGSTLYVGGGFSHIGGEARANIAALSTSTGLATAWDPSADNKIVRAILVSGSIVYVGGSFSHFGPPSPDGQDRNGIAALRASNGQPTDWDPNASSAVFALELSGTTLYVGGGFATIGGQPRDHIAALSTSTGEALDWNPGAQLGDVRSIVRIGKRVYIAGGFTVIGGGPGGVGGKPRNHLAVVSAITGKAMGWNPQANDSASILVRGPGNTLFTGGAFTNVGGQTLRNNIAAFDAATGLVSSVNPDANGPVHALTAFGNTLYMAGEFTTLQGGTFLRNRLAALDASSGAPTVWNPAADGTVRAVAVSPDGITVYVGGDFTHAGSGLPLRNHIAALTASTGSPTTWDAGTTGGPDSGRVSALATTSNKIYVGGSFTTIAGLARTGLAFLKATGTTGPCPGVSCPVLAWDPSPNGEVNTILVGGITLCSADAGATPTIYIGGDFTALNGASGGAAARNHLAAVKSSSSTPDVKVCDWNPGADGTVRALAQSGDMLFMGGDFTSAGGVSPRNHLAAVDVVTGGANTWNPGADNSVRALATSDNPAELGMLYAGGNFATMSGSTDPVVGLSRNNLAAFSFPTLDSMISPLSRTVSVGDTASALLTIVNGSPTTATGVTIQYKTNIPGTPPFSFRTFDSGTGSFGPPNVPVDIAGLGSQVFFLTFDPGTAITPPTEVKFAVEGDNTNSAGSISGWNTMYLAASNPPPTADILTATGTTQITFPTVTHNCTDPTATQASFAFSTFNGGAAQQITVVSRGQGAVSGNADVGICLWDTGLNQCVAPPAASLSFASFDSGTGQTFMVFVKGTTDASAIPCDFANNRLFIEFREGNTTKGPIRGLDSIAACTVGVCNQ